MAGKSLTSIRVEDERIEQPCIHFSVQGASSQAQEAVTVAVLQAQMEFMRSEMQARMDALQAELQHHAAPAGRRVSTTGSLAVAGLGVAAGAAVGAGLASTARSTPRSAPTGLTCELPLGAAGLAAEAISHAEVLPSGSLLPGTPGSLVPEQVAQQLSDLQADIDDLRADTSGQLLGLGQEVQVSVQVSTMVYALGTCCQGHAQIAMADNRIIRYAFLCCIVYSSQGFLPVAACDAQPPCSCTLVSLQDLNAFKLRAEAAFSGLAGKVTELVARVSEHDEVLGTVTEELQSVREAKRVCSGR